MKHCKFLILFFLLQANFVKAQNHNPAFPGWYADPEGSILANQYWIFPGTTIMPLSKIFVCFGLDTSTSTQIQIIDQNSTLIIADRTITTGGLQIIDMGTLTNMNTLNTIWTIKISTSIAAQSTLYYLLMKV